MGGVWVLQGLCRGAKAGLPAIKPGVLDFPFAVALEGSVYTEPPPPDQRVYATFCGT